MHVAVGSKRSELGCGVPKGHKREGFCKLCTASQQCSWFVGLPLCHSFLFRLQLGDGGRHLRHRHLHVRVRLGQPLLPHPREAPRVPLVRRQRAGRWARPSLTNRPGKVSARAEQPYDSGTAASPSAAAPPPSTSWPEGRRTPQRPSARRAMFRRTGRSGGWRPSSRPERLRQHVDARPGGTCRCRLCRRPQRRCSRPCVVGWDRAEVVARWHGKYLGICTSTRCPCIPRRQPSASSASEDSETGWSVASHSAETGPGFANSPASVVPMAAP